MNGHLITKKTLRQEKKHRRRLVFGSGFRVLLSVVLFACGFLYVLETNAASTKGFVMSDLEQSIAELERENQRLSVEIAEHRSMNSIAERLKDTNFVSADSVAYISPEVLQVVASR